MTIPTHTKATQADITTPIHTTFPHDLDVSPPIPPPAAPIPCAIDWGASNNEVDEVDDERIVEEEEGYRDGEGEELKEGVSGI